MQSTPENEQSERDRRLLMRLLLLPTKRQARLIRILSRPYWDGVGAIFGILSFIVTTVVTIVLTFYIFDLTREQTTANLDYTYVGEVLSDTDEGRLMQQYLMLGNNGPATGESVLVTVTSDKELDCNADMGDRIPQNYVNVTVWQIIKPSKIVGNAHRCDFFYDYFYPKSYTLMTVGKYIYKADGRWLDIDVFISGVNVNVSFAEGLPPNLAPPFPDIDRSSSEK